MSLTLKGKQECNDFIDGYIFDSKYEDESQRGKYEEWKVISHEISSTKHSEEFHEVIMFNWIYS